MGRGEDVRVVAFSDSHGDRAALREAFRLAEARLRANGRGGADGAADCRANGRAHADVYVFLGDGADDFDLLREEKQALGCAARFVCVRGNCDPSRCGAAEEETFVAGGVRFLAAHGHRYGVKHSLFTLTLRAREADAAVALYGHTHLPNAEWVDGVLCVNPGAACVVGGRAVAAIVTVAAGGAISAELVGE